MRLIGTIQRANTMIVIISRDTIKFTEGKRTLSIEEGFRRLDQRYRDEPQEVKRKIQELRERFYKA